MCGSAPKTYPSPHRCHHQAQTRRFANQPSLHSSCHVTPVERGSREKWIQGPEASSRVSTSGNPPAARARRRNSQAWRAYYLVSAAWPANHPSATLICSALYRWLHLPAWLRSTISVPTARTIQQNRNHYTKLATEANPPLIVSPVRGASTGTMGLRFRQGVPQTPKVEQYLCPLSVRPTTCSDSRAPRATRSCLPPRTALR